MRRIILAVMLCGFAGSTLAQSDSVKQALLKADRDFNQATQEHRLDGWMQYMDENGVVQRDKPVVGTEAVRAALKDQWADPNFHLAWNPDEAYAMPGNRMGYTRGHWTLTTKDKEGKSLKMTGQYLTIWRQNKEGDWKIIWDGGSADPPKQ
ncbi:MAG: nuclear transport factor 2 family protein [Terriglobia bacterium]|nr:nuclear transport factor 2 family protein [Terriglobia bacterium]